MMQIH